MKCYKEYLFITFLFSIITIPFLNKGLGSIDAHGILESANRVIIDGTYSPSRPPGHPSYEIYLLYPIGKALHILTGNSLSGFHYNVIQYLSSLGCCLIFFRILLLLKKNIKIAILGSFSLALLPSFYRNSIDGDEFNQALLCFLIALFFLIRCLTDEKQNTTKALILSSLSMAFATGFRQEFIVTFLIFPLFFWIHNTLELKAYLKWIPWQLFSGFLIWIPVLVQNGFQIPVPMPIPENDALQKFSYKIMVGSYKILFQGFTPILLVFLLITGWKHKKILNKSLKSFPIDTFILSVTILIGGSYLILFYSYPYKSDFLHPIFALILASFIRYTSNRWVYGLIVVSIISFLFSFEIAHGRKIGNPYPSYGHGIKAIFGKTYFQKEPLLQNLQKIPEGKNVYIANMRNTDLDYLFKTKLLDVEIEPVEINLQTWKLNNDSTLLIADKSILEKENSLQDFVNKGYNLYIENQLFHTFFYRYDLKKSLSSEEVYDGIKFHLINE